MMAMVLVWVRPLLSVSGTRWTRCTPASHLSLPYAPSPSTRNVHSLRPSELAPTSAAVDSSTVVRQPLAWAKRTSMSRTSRVKRAASDPPWPALSSMMHDRCDDDDGGSRCAGSVVDSSRSICWRRSATSSVAMARRDSSGSDSSGIDSSSACRDGQRRRAGAAPAYQYPSARAPADPLEGGQAHAPTEAPRTLSSSRAAARVP